MDFEAMIKKEKKRHARNLEVITFAKDNLADVCNNVEDGRIFIKPMYLEEARVIQSGLEKKYGKPVRDRVYVSAFEDTLCEWLKYREAQIGFYYKPLEEAVGQIMGKGWEVGEKEYRERELIESAGE